MKVHSPGNTSTPRADLEWSRGDDGVVCGKVSKGEIDWPVGRGEAKIHYINGGGRCLPILNPHKDLWRGHGKPKLHFVTEKCFPLPFIWIRKKPGKLRKHQGVYNHTLVIRVTDFFTQITICHVRDKKGA